MFHSTLQALSPAKLILTGEHAVVHGAPAYVLAVNRYATATIQPHTTGSRRLCNLNLVDLQHTAASTFYALKELKARLLEAYHRCLEGELRIRDVLQRPVQLFQYAVGALLEACQVGLTKGFKVDLQSTIPIGCGMGSSAATLLSVLMAIARFLQIDLPTERLYKLCVEAERLQHGRSSGIDPYVSLHGGFVRFQDGQATSLPLPRLPGFLVHTGAPASSTGECVMRVGHTFATSAIWQEFAEVADGVAADLHDIARLQLRIRQNHRLLVTLGVVPEKVQAFISEIETWGAAAKVCGAGSVAGDAAGVVLVVAEEAPIALCHRYGYSIDAIEGEPRGTRLV